MAENQNGLSVPIKTSQSDICPLRPHASIIFFFSCLQSIVCNGHKHRSSDDLFGEKDPHPLLTQQTLLYLELRCRRCSSGWGTSLVGSKTMSLQVGTVPQHVPKAGAPSCTPEMTCSKTQNPMATCCPEQHSPPPCSSCRHAFIGRHSAYKPQASFWVCCHS